MNILFYECEQGRLFKGELVVNDKICHRVIIEADSREEARAIAESLGIYFDGVKKGIDTVKDKYGFAEDRWEGPKAMDIENGIPGGLARCSQVKRLENDMESRARSVCLDSKDILRGTDPDIRIYYKDGTVKEFYPPRSPKLYRIVGGQKIFL